jgi:hypothetical protein
MWSKADRIGGLRLYLKGDVLMKCFKLLLLFLAMTVTVSCSRPSHENKSTIRLSIPTKSKVGAYATLSASHAIINVSGPDMPNPILWDWDACPQGCMGGMTMTLPDSIPIVVPANHDYLIQVLVVYEDSDTGQAEFNYGDSSNSDFLTYTRIKDPDVSIPITIQSISTGDGKMVNIRGRYLDTAASGPSGRVGVYYQPVGDKPRMKIKNTFMYSGFSEFFAIDGLSFDYILEDQQRILLTDFSPSSPDLAASAHLLYVNIPSPIYQVDTSTGSTRYNLENSDSATKTRAIGYFGSGAATASVCFDKADSPIALGGYVTSTSGTPLYYTGNNSAASSLNINGGSSTCPAGIENESFIKFHYDKFNDNDGVNFRGAFLAQISAGSLNQDQNFVNIESQNNSSALLKWTFVPGLIVDRTTIFRNDNFSPELERVLYRENGVDCNKLFGLGFYVATEVKGSEITLASLTSGKSEVMVCPVINGKLLGGITANLRSFSLSSQPCIAGYYRDNKGICQPNLNNSTYEVRTYSFPNAQGELITTGSCKNIDIELINPGTNTSVTAGSNMNLRVLSGSISSGTFYGDLNCSATKILATAGFGGWPFSDNSGNAQIFDFQYRNLAWPAGVNKLSLSFRAGPVNTKDHFIFELDLGAGTLNPAVHRDACVGSPCSGGPNHPYVRIEAAYTNTGVSPIQNDGNGNYRIKNNACYEVKAALYGVSAGSGPSPHYYVTGGSSVNIALSSASFPNLYFYTTPDCSTASLTSTNVFVPTGTFNSPNFSLKYDVATSGTLTLNFAHLTSTDGTVSFGNNWQNVNYFIIDPNVTNGSGGGGSNFQINGAGNTYPINTCIQFSVNNPTGANTDVSFWESGNATGGTFYQGLSCGGTVVSAGSFVNIGYPTSANFSYYISSTGGSVSLNVTDGSANSYGDGHYDIINVWDPLNSTSTCNYLSGGYSNRYACECNSGFTWSLLQGRCQTGLGCADDSFYDSSNSTCYSIPFASGGFVLGFGNSQPKVSVNNCSRFEVTVGSGISGSVYLNANASQGTLYDNPRCTTAIPYPAGINSKRDFYYYTTNNSFPQNITAGTQSGISTATLQITSGTFAGCSLNTFYDPVSNSCPPAYGVFIAYWNGNVAAWNPLVNNFSVSSNACTPILLRYYEKIGDGNINFTNATTTVNVDLQLSQGSFYNNNDPSCVSISSGSHSTFITVGSLTSGSFYIKGGNPGTTTLNTNISAPSFLMGVLPVTNGSFW